MDSGKFSVKFEEGNDEDGNTGYHVTIQFPAPHLAPNQVVTQEYYDHNRFKVSAQAAEDIRQYIEDPEEFITQCLREKSWPELAILQLRFEITGLRRMIAHSDQNVRIWQESIRTKQSDIESLEKEMKKNQ